MRCASYSDLAEILVLSTPNVDSTLDGLTYLVEGHRHYFGERDYLNSGGHITEIQTGYSVALPRAAATRTWN